MRIAAAALLLLCLTPALSAQSFLRGDCNADTGTDISDPIFFLDYLFGGGGPISCEDACDSNDDGGLDISDAIFTLTYLFSGGSLPAPSGACGTDPTADALGCISYPCGPPPEDCTNMVDDDLDGQIDCADPDCVADPACPSGPTLSADIQPIFDANCAFCHDSGSSPFAGLNLETNVLMNTVNVPSTECTTVDLIEPGDPTNSWLYRKIEGTHTQPDLGCTGASSGSQMPIGAFCCLTPAEMALIAQWIMEGAAP